MVTAGVDALLLSVGADLPYFTGYEAMPLERLTMLVLGRDGDATLVVPELEAPRVAVNGSCTIRPGPKVAIRWGSSRHWYAERRAGRSR